MPGKVDETFEVGRIARSGPFGTVHVATERESGRAVHLQFLQFDAPTEPLKERLRATGRTLGKLRHPNVASPLAVGSDGPRAFVASKRVAGTPLSEVAAAGLDQSELFEAVSEILSGLAAAHRAGVVHGDLRDGTVLRDEHGTFRIVDFGAGHFLSEVSELRTGRLQGRARYCAPERFRGYVNVSGDVYTCGLLLWELVLGAPAVSSDTEDDAMDAHLGSKPWKVPEFASVPAPLVTLIETALQRHPRKRYRDAVEMLEFWELHAPEMSEAIEAMSEARFQLDFESSAPAVEEKSLDPSRAMVPDSDPFSLSERSDMIDPNTEFVPDLLSEASEVEDFSSRLNRVEAGEEKRIEPVRAEPASTREASIDAAREKLEIDYARVPSSTTMRRPGKTIDEEVRSEDASPILRFLIAGAVIVAVALAASLLL